MSLTLKEAALLLLSLRRAPVLVEEAEDTLLRLVTLARQILERLASSRLLASANNPAMLVLNEVRLLEAAGRLLRRSMENLCLRTNIHRKIRHLILDTHILTKSFHQQKT